MRNLHIARCCAALVLASFVSSFSVAGPGSSKARSRAKLSDDLAAQLNSGDASRTVDVIIQTDGPSLDDLRAHLNRHGGASGGDLKLIGGVPATVPVSEIDSIAGDGVVRRISPNRPLGAAVNVATQPAGASWSRSLVPSGAGLTGSGVGVAVIDSGIYLHEDLAGAVLATVDFVDPTRRGSAVADDPYGHGTHVAGIIAGRLVPLPGRDGFAGGVAPGAHLISLRVLDHKGVGKSSDVIAALEWCVNHKAEYGIRVINLSLGQPVAEAAVDDPLDQAVQRAWRAGLVVVAAGGNAGLLGSGYGMISSPGNDPLALAVGALDDDEAALFSSKGPTRFDFTLKPDIVAPGTRVVSLRVPHSTLDRSLPGARVSLNSAGSSKAFEPRYFQMSGSSMAAAMVSGAVALMLEADPSLSPDDIKARLMRHADHFGSQDIYTRGAGALDLGAALSASGRAAASASPAVSLSASSADDDDEDVVVEETGAAWGDMSLWSLQELYGDPNLWNEEVTQSFSLFDDACMTGQGLTWQHAVANGVIWQHAVAEGIIWQTLTSEGLTWQHLKGSGLTWQHSYGDGICPF